MIRQASIVSGIVIASFWMPGTVAAPLRAVPDCLAPWQVAWASDSSFHLCLPPGFAARESGVWARPRHGSAGLDLIAVELLRGAAEFADTSTWPPRLMSSPAGVADGIVAEDVTTYVDPVDGVEAHTEVGLVSGGFAGMRRLPFFRSGWRSSADAGGYAQGWAAERATIDTLRMVLRSVHVRR